MLAAPVAQAAEDLVIGGSIPLSGVFAFAGQGIHAGIGDYVKMVNEEGGVAGRKLVYVPEDTAYKVDASVAAFKKIASQNKVNFYYGDSTGFSKTINAELNRAGTMIMTGASFATELNDPAKYPNQFMLGPDYTEMFGILLRYIAKEQPGAKVAFVYSDTEFGRDPITSSRAVAEKLGLKVVTEIMTPPGSVDVSTEVIAAPRRAGLHHFPWLCPGADSGVRRPGQAHGPEDALHGHLLDHGQLHGHADGRGRGRLHGRDALSLLLR